ncbi:MAG: T9SS type A sorting domain-containing protein [Flavobacterium sp. JAD_PAG50586_2]|nr:MAG: T9SS type A sorting domain-containing protein [Flavobacterium sp. JAD_PAG50586_2]
MNKIKYIILLLMCFSIDSWGQVLSQTEYFWDTDPGEGNGIAFTAADGSFNSGIEGFSLSNISVPATTGLHIFGVRSKDSNNNWGPVNKQVIDVSPVLLGNNAVPTLAQAEYFWDTDPGVGNATAFAAEDANFNATIESLLQNNITVPTVSGLHTFNVRVKDSNDQWGPVNNQVIDLSNALLGTNAVPTIAAVEYFWDTDPGQGSGMAFPSADAGFDSTIEHFVKGDVGIVNPVGLHVFNVRAKDDTGNWGPVNKQVIIIETVLSVDPNTMADSYYFIPNPATSVIRFNKDIESVIVVDLNGRLMTTSTANNEVNIEGLATGTYILKVTTPEGLTFNKKMIKR